MVLAWQPLPSVLAASIDLPQCEAPKEMCPTLGAGVVVVRWKTGRRWRAGGWHDVRRKQARWRTSDLSCQYMGHRK
jgi:hypothetical protein